MYLLATCEPAAAARRYSQALRLYREALRDTDGCLDEDTQNIRYNLYVLATQQSSTGAEFAQAKKEVMDAIFGGASKALAMLGEDHGGAVLIMDFDAGLVCRAYKGKRKRRWFYGPRALVFNPATRRITVHDLTPDDASKLPGAPLSQPR